MMEDLVQFLLEKKCIFLLTKLTKFLPLCLLEHVSHVSPIKRNPVFQQLCTYPSWLEWWMLGYHHHRLSSTEKSCWLSGMGLGSGNFRCGSWHLVHRGWYDLLSQADQITMSGRGFLLVGGFNSSKSQRSYVSTSNKKVPWSQQNFIGDSGSTFVCST